MASVLKSFDLDFKNKATARLLNLRCVIRMRGAAGLTWILVPWALRSSFLISSNYRQI